MAPKVKDRKIMLRGPRPDAAYLNDAAQEPVELDSPQHLLVVLDLNGTLLHRPNRKQPTRFVARPSLDEFLQYLFQRFSVMVWSSARPENVTKLVESALDDDMRSKLLGVWARDTFKLSEEHYFANVQVYKDLREVWKKDEIQRQMPGFSKAERFGQHNTILIDDSKLKAIAQPHNLLEIPEFTATPEQMTSDILKEVAGYLENARMQKNVSSFIQETPFKADGTWTRQWDELQTSFVSVEKEESEEDVKKEDAKQKDAKQETKN